MSSQRRDGLGQRAAASTCRARRMRPIRSMYDGPVRCRAEPNQPRHPSRRPASAPSLPVLQSWSNLLAASSTPRLSGQAPRDRAEQPPARPTPRTALLWSREKAAQAHPGSAVIPVGGSAIRPAPDGRGPMGRDGRIRVQRQSQVMLISWLKSAHPARRNALAMGTLPRSVEARIRGTSSAARIRVPSASNSSM